MKAGMSALAELPIYREYAHGQAVMRIDVVKFKFDEQTIIDFTKTQSHKGRHRYSRVHIIKPFSRF